MESVAENTSDAVVAPLLWGALAGMPGLLVYRAINTLDAMIGHRSARYRRFGWAAARLDDLANWVPARVVGTGGRADGAAGRRHRRPSALRAMVRDAGRHPSPNAGVVEAAFAGALGVRLGGRNVYARRSRRIADGWVTAGRCEVDDVARAVRLADAVGVVSLDHRGAAAGAPPMTVLIIGGTAEARALAADLVGAGVDVITSLAGRVRDPALPAGPVRIGGFGGVAGLVAFLIEQRITAVVDASHPFAAQISTNVERASVEVGVPLLRLERPGWAEHPRGRVVDLGADADGGARTPPRRTGDRS